ncbi:M66 family metalloprotease [Psychrobacter sp. DAB_AL32B]|uniref:M66 family metalloprotease n=1 Tax=Psychrobacter sp. DAB_AL32B TaxID=1028414 RepID=UPI000B7D80D4|nr:M66 family metalloprotease [Psychrobacter sp. DAB_AL32B]OXL18240.1 glycosyl transferase [Psychrobacter sp. DAB_AL32B]
MKTTIKFPVKALSIGIIAILLAACGEGDGSTTPAVTPPVTSIPSTPIGPSTQLKYPEPKKDITDAYLLGFFDHAGRAGAIRDIRPDLVGTFQAMIQFGQNHTVDPQGNEAKNMPRLTAEKEALLLVTPTLEMGDIDKLVAEIYKDGALLRSVSLAEPTQIPATDQTNTDKRPRVSYSNRAWSTKLKWNEVEGGLKIRIVDEKKRSGDLLEDKIDFAAPGELVLTNIRLGMLTAPPQSWGHYMLRDPERAGSDYFQTIPAAQMTVAVYDDMKLDRVMVGNGTIYDSVSSSDGGMYNGDMRENTAKATFGVGINLANWGVTSASLHSQEQPQLTQNVNAHHARGKYANGEHNHGLSGGNGMLTIIDSVRNEFSHEIGHHYGLGHYPGASGGDYFWAEHHADSGWGYNGFRNKMRGNLDWPRQVEGDGLSGKPLFLATYGYGRDAMSGGSQSGAYSDYTHYTGYSTKIKIQPAFDRAVFDADSPTGYKKWNAELRKMEVIQPKVPRSGNVWYNSADGNYLKARLQGVPVFTILGGYDPVAQKGIIYPEARGNWGNVFDLPTPNNSLEAASCWLSVTYSNSTVNNIALSPNRMNGNANKFHVNLAIAEDPKKVDLYCKKANEAQVQLSTIDIRQYSDPIRPAVTFGKEHGYTALRKVELPGLEQQLIAQAENPTVTLNTNGKLLYDSYKEYRDELSPQALETLERYEQQQETIYRLNRWVNVYRTDLIKKEPEALSEFQQFVKWLELQDDKPLENVATIRNGNNCLKVEKLENGKLNSFISGPSGCTGDDSEQWVYDLKGKIHSKMALDQCLTEQGSWVNLGACSLDSPAQVWEMNGTDQIKQGNKCFDLRTGHLVDNRGSLIIYNCNGGWNQKWTTLTKNPSFILATAGNNLPLIVDSLQKQPVTMDNLQTRSLSMDSTEEPSVLAKVSTAISTWIDNLFS